MEYKFLPLKKRKLDRSILEEIGTISGSREQGNTHCDTLPEIKSFAPISAQRVHRSRSPQKLKIQSGEAFVKPNVISLGIDAVGEQDRYLTYERGDHEFNENPHPESLQKNRMGFGGSQHTDAACDGMTKFLKEPAPCSTDTDVVCNHRVLMKGAHDDIDGFNCPSMPSDNEAHVASENIWEGSVQFDSNTTVPIIAFFKGGQKLSDINWSSLVVIKGKIPLEDFEKYIKDLPRSRTRKLMVISLYLKLDSSRAGLECLKEVVKSYKMNKKVAYAVPSPDVRLYLYPWSKVITTSLVQCGYLGEKAAVADMSELLMGCIIWRNHITAGSLLKLSENRGVEPLKEQGFKSPVIEVQKNSGSRLDQSKNRGTNLLKDQEVWSPVRTDHTTPGATLNLKFRNEHQESGCSNLPFNDSKGQQLQTAPTSGISYKAECSTSDPLVLSSGKFICERHDKKNLSVGDDNDLSMLEPSVAEKKEPSLPSHSEPFKTSSQNLPEDSPGHPTPSKFPMTLDSSHEPRRYNGSPPSGKILPPVPNLQNSLSRYFTFLQSPGQPSSVPDVHHPSTK